MKSPTINNFSSIFSVNGNSKLINLTLIVLPLFLSAFVHLWNVSQFPAFHPDEGVYIRRALHILAGLGPHDPSSSFDHSQDSTSSFDHPYFGQIFLAGIFKLIGFPDSLNTTSDISSIENLYSIPRLIMGLLAIIDTFLVYKISETRFNKHIAFFAAILFAVMPLTWFMRRIVLDSIMLPFILTSILLAMKIKYRDQSKLILVVLMSGIFLGLAIFTKIPAFTMMPLIGFLIYQTLIYHIGKQKNKEIKTKFEKLRLDSNKLKILSLWLIPVIIIPLIWPAYAIFTDKFDGWIDGVFWQGTERKDKGKSLSEMVLSFWKTDPLLFVLGAFGIIYCTLKKEFIPLLWILPYVIFLYFIGWVTHFHLILIMPALCIAAAKLVFDISEIQIFKEKKWFISYGCVLLIAIFGIISTFLMISVDLSYVQIHAISFIAREIDEKHDLSNDNGIQSNATNKKDITVISSPISSWVYRYVFDHEKTFSHVRDTQPITTSKILMLVDSTYKHVISKTEGENQSQIDRLNNIYNNTEIIALFKDDKSNYDRDVYPYTGFNSANIGSRSEEIRTNY